jgi:hypothetical protein
MTYNPKPWQNQNVDLRMTKNIRRDYPRIRAPACEIANPHWARPSNIFMSFYNLLRGRFARACSKPIFGSLVLPDLFAA